jgi:hypothetical protein
VLQMPAGPAGAAAATAAAGASDAACSSTQQSAAEQPYQPLLFAQRAGTAHASPAAKGSY